MWKFDSVFKKIWHFSPHPFNCRKIGYVHLSSNIFLLLSLISDSRARFEYVYIQIYVYICLIWICTWKVEILQKEKQDFERLLLFLNIKMSAKSNKIELSEEFMAMWRDKQIFWDVISLLCWDKNEK